MESEASRAARFLALAYLSCTPVTVGAMVVVFVCHSESALLSERIRRKVSVYKLKRKLFVLISPL